MRKADAFTQRSVAGVPEQVADGGVDDLRAAGGLNLQVLEVAVTVDHHRGDDLGLVLAGAGVAGQDLVLNWLMETVLPLASRTRVLAVNDWPPQDAAAGFSSAGALAVDGKQQSIADRRCPNR